MRFSFAGSLTLVEQVRQGAPAQLLLLAEKVETPSNFEEPMVFAYNQLVLCTRKPPCRIEDITFKVRLAVGDPALAPVGKHARKVADQLKLEPTWIYTRDDRSALLTLDSGHADMAIVYRSDVGSRAFCPFDYPKVAYYAYIHQQAPASVRQFVSYLTGPEGKADLTHHGFLVP